MRRTKSSAKAVKPVTHEQWIEIRRVNGRTVSTFYPPNKLFEKQRREKDPQPVLIYRRLFFIRGVPSEYNWTNPEPDQRVYGGLFLQRLKVEDWLAVYTSELAEGNQHATCGANPQPRPEAFGPCPCDRCTADRELFDDA